MKLIKTLAAGMCAALLLTSLAACGGSDDGRPLDLTILHVNDHHSRLDAETVNLSVRTAAGGRENVTFPLGGFARVAQAMDEPSRSAITSSTRVTRASRPSSTSCARATAVRRCFLPIPTSP